MNKHSRLAFEFIFGFILLGFLICFTSSYIGYNQFRKTIEKNYNKTAYDIASVAASYLEYTNIIQYYHIAKSVANDGSSSQLNTALESEDYHTLCTNFQKLKINMQANDIFLVYVNKQELLSYSGTTENWFPIVYIVDCFDSDQYDFNLGSKGDINPKFIQEALYIIETGNRSDNYFISRRFHGYNTSALLPIPIEDDILILGVEIPMLYIEQSLNQYLTYAVCVSLIIIIFIIIIYMVYFYFKVFKPLKSITQEIKTFFNNEKRNPNPLVKINMKNEIGYLAHSILKMEKDLTTYIDNLTIVTKEKERMNAELSIAAQIQQSILPIQSLYSKEETFTLASFIQPAKSIGGDFYDFFFIDDSHLAIIIADVSGKGIPAALFMMMGKTILKQCSLESLDLAQTFSKVNQFLCASNQEGLFITAFEAILDLKTGELSYVNAGHEPPFIFHKGKFTSYFLEPDFVLAGMENSIYHVGHMVLEEGDILLEYTDGVTEATNLHLEQFGLERVEQVLKTALEPSEILERMKSSIDLFVGNAPQFDDITMLCLKFKKKQVKKS